LLLWLAQLLELLDDLDGFEAEEEEVLDDSELQLLLRLLEQQLLLLILSLFELDEQLLLGNDEDLELLEQLFDISLRHEEEQEEHEKYSITEKQLHEQLLELELSCELELEEQQRGLLFEWLLDEQLEEYDHLEGLLHDELEDMDLVEELKLEQEDGRFEQLDIELLELLLDFEAQDFEAEELEHEWLLLLMLEQELLREIDTLEFEEDDELDDLELPL
jgi:hypothetical protein